MSEPTFKPSEGKRQEFRRYLEQSGVIDALTKVLVSLYEEPEKPEDALEYIRNILAMQAGLETFTQMKLKVEEFESKVDQLELELDQLKLNEQPPPLEDEEFVGHEEGDGNEVRPLEENPEPEPEPAIPEFPAVIDENEAPVAEE